MRRSEHHQEVHERHCGVKVANPSETRGFVSYLGSPGGGNFQSSARVFASALYLCFASSSSDTGPWPSIVTLLLAQQPMAPVSCEIRSAFLTAHASNTRSLTLAFTFSQRSREFLRESSFAESSVASGGARGFRQKSLSACARTVPDRGEPRNTQ